jgi:hypothetical protein
MLRAVLRVLEIQIPPSSSRPLDGENAVELMASRASRWLPSSQSLMFRE